MSFMQVDSVRVFVYNSVFFLQINMFIANYKIIEQKHTYIVE